MLKSIRFWEKLSLKRFRKQRLASIFLLSLTISVWLGAILPIYPQNPQKSDREIIIQEIKDYANSHVQNDEEKQILLMLELYENNDVGLNARQIGKIYQDEYTRLKKIKDQEKKDLDIRKLIIDNLFKFLGWGAAVIIAIFGGKLKNWVEEFANKIWNWIYNQVSGLKFFWAFSLKIYRESLFNKYRQLKIPFRPNRPLEMRDIFVPLKVSGKSDNSQIDAFAAIEKYPRLMITGSPGSGKSMLLKYLAFSWTEEKLSKISPKVTPVLLELNRLNELQEFTIEKFQIKLVEAFKREDFPDANNFVAQALDNGNLMLLLDGLDEVNSNVRDRVIRLIKNLLDTYENCPVIITCRSAVYHNEFVNYVNQTLEIVEFSDHQIRNFLKVWESELPPEKSIEQLISTLRDRPQIMALARNPLLLTIIAYLYADTSFVLPYSRASFYEEAITHLLKLRDEERQISNKFEAIHKRRVLQKLALFAQDNASLLKRDRRNIEYEQVLDQIRDLLPSLNLNTERDTQEVLDEIVDRSGLLLPIDGGQRYQFSHLTLQEYFAAEALANQESELVSRFKTDTVTWRETVKLWCGLSGNKTSLIKQVYQIDPLTGFECLAEAKEVDQELADEIINYFKQQLSKVIDDDNVAKAFGTVAADLRPSSRGKFVFEFLETTLNNNSDVSNQKASAKALSFTNLPQAVSILAEGYKRNKEYCEILSDEDYDNCLTNIREALVRMGDLAVSQLATLVKQKNFEVIQDLTKIATPDATKTLVNFLWHTNGSLRYSTAWNLAESFTKVDFTKTIQEFELTAEQKNSDYLYWIWQPFNNSSSQSLSIIAGRIVYLLDKTPTELIPNSLPQLDPRLVVPLLSIHNVVEIQSKLGKGMKFADKDAQKLHANISNYDRFAYRNRRNPTSTDSFIESKIIEQVNQILGSQLSHSRWGIILSCLKPRLQLDLLRRLINQRCPSYKDWHNIFLDIDIKYKFQHSYHYRLVLAVGLITSVVAIAEMILLMFHQCNSSINFFSGLAIYILLVFWISLLQGIEEPHIFLQLGLLGILTFGTEIRGLSIGRSVLARISLFFRSAAIVDCAVIVGTIFYVLAGVDSCGPVATTGMVINCITVSTFCTYADVVTGVVCTVGVVVIFVFLALAGGDTVAISALITAFLIGIGIGVWHRVFLVSGEFKDEFEIDYCIIFLAIFAFPLFCWFPIVVFFSTLFMLRFLTWQYTALIWLIVLGTCTSLWLYGQNKERKASNPLQGILDVAK